jgi:Zn-dependent peptidase ImmA (M78 family)
VVLSPLGNLFHPQPGNIRAERSAEKCLEHCRAKLGLSEIPLPVPVDVWIETVFGITFGITDLSHLGPDVLGAAYVKEHEIAISVEAAKHEGRYRFTCAHELAHFVLHTHIACAFTDGELPRLGFSVRLDRQADKFAAAFLMPLPLFERELVRFSNSESMDAEYCLAELMMPSVESLWLWEKFYVPFLSERFGISKTALVYRCRDLRYETEDGRSLMPARIQNAILGKTPFGEMVGAMRLVDGRPRPISEYPRR